MGKPKKCCSNPLHDEWCRNAKKVGMKVKMPSYKHLMLMKKLAKDRGFVSHHIRSVCLECLEVIEKQEEMPSSDQTESSTSQVMVCIPSLSLLIFLFSFHLIFLLIRSLLDL